MFLARLEIVTQEGHIIGLTRDGEYAVPLEFILHYKEARIMSREVWLSLIGYSQPKTAKTNNYTNLSLSEKVLK